jgi:hypothetical protein
MTRQQPSSDRTVRPVTEPLWRDFARLFGAALAVSGWLAGAPQQAAELGMQAERILR